MKKLSKFLCLALCICMVLTMPLTGCTESAENPEGTTVGKTKASESTAPNTKTELEPYEVVWYFGGNGSEPNEKLIEEEIGKYLKDKINTTVDIITYPFGEVTQKVKTIISSGEKADLVFSCSWVLEYTSAIRDKLFTEITDDMLNNYAPHAKEVLSGAWLDGAKVDGKLYHLACNKEIGAQGGVLLNKALVDKYGFDYTSLKKYEDLYPMLQTIKEKEPDIIPIDTCAGSTISYLIDCMGNCTGDLINIKFPLNGTKWVSVFDIPEVADAMKVAKKFADAGFVRKDAVTVRDVLPDHKAGKVFAANFQLKPAKNKEYEGSTPGVEWVQAGFTEPVIRSGDVTGSMMAIPRTCPEPSRVLMFYDYFYHDKNMLTLVNYGIEGMHYVKIDENTIDYAPATENGTKSGWKPSSSIWEVGDQFKNYLLKSEDPKKYENLLKFNANCKTFGDTTGFRFDKSKCENAYDLLRVADADTYTLLMMGLAGDVDTAIAKQVKIWNDAGMQEMLVEYNKQYEAWLASK